MDLEGFARDALGSCVFKSVSTCSAGRVLEYGTRALGERHRSYLVSPPKPSHNRVWGHSSSAPRRMRRSDRVGSRYYNLGARHRTLISSSGISYRRVFSASERWSCRSARERPRRRWGCEAASAMGAGSPRRHFRGELPCWRTCPRDLSGNKAMDQVVRRGDSRGGCANNGSIRGAVDPSEATVMTVAAPGLAKPTKR